MKTVLMVIVGIIAVLAGVFGTGFLKNEKPAEPPAIIIPSQIQTYFPRAGQDASTALISLYNNATKSLDVAIYSLTYPSIVKALGDAKKRSVVVRVITDEQQAGGKSQTVAIDDLLLNGIPVKIDNHSGLMHLKLSIIDYSISTTGSYNYSAGATEDNDEMLVIISEPTFVKQCQSEFERLWASPKFVNAVMSY